MIILLRVALAFLLLGAVIARAQDASSNPEAQARSFLVPCTAGTQQDCRKSQESFVRLYVGAMSGDFLSALAVAVLFDPASNPGTTGVQRSPVQACAWWMLLALTTSENPNYVAFALHHCSPLSSADRASARRRLEEIVAELRTP